MSGADGKHRQGPKVTKAVARQVERHAKIVVAVRGSRGNLEDAAHAMGIALSTFTRYVMELQIGGEVRRLAEEAKKAEDKARRAAS